MWLKYAGLKGLVENKWHLPIEGNAQFILTQRAKAFQSHLKTFNFKELSNISERAGSARISLATAQERLDQNPLDRDLSITVRDQCRLTYFLDSAEKDFYSQKAKSRHLIKSDRNSNFFHSIVKRNNSRNSISFICRKDGQTSFDQDVIAADFVEFYKELFGSRKPASPIDPTVLTSGCCLDDHKRMDMIKLVSPEDIKTALFDIDNDKASGPDGYSSAFFKKFWDIIGNDVTNDVCEFFATGQLLKRLNTTIIALIPKIKINHTVADFRSIACCNVIYKMITKIIANRVAYALPEIINPTQSAFIRGRNIMDNVILAQELMRKCTRKRSTPRCAIKIDLKKAYDTISWDFLRELLMGLNFHPVFINWIMQCVTSPSFSIAINGSLHGFFPGQRGLKQGDPMSPTFFILCMEYLSHLLNIRTLNINFNFHAKCSKCKITHLAFADDLMLFGRGDFMSMKVLADTLKEFSKCSGLEINQDKSNIFAGGVHMEELDRIRELFGFLIGELPVKYLGVPLASKRLNLSHYFPLIDQISSFY